MLVLQVEQKRAFTIKNEDINEARDLASPFLLPCPYPYAYPERCPCLAIRDAAPRPERAH